jgi:uncharacterized protein YyaL (SSP411 family)
MPSNSLIHEKSPYLLQHAHNPVDWRPWGEEAFTKAREENKPIFLSVGYSTCHWCHVMERESFENEEIAALLNRDFVPIKVDREERPDVDRVYMLFVQATTGSGGWPMSVWLTPQLQPFFGGTYFPPDAHYGRPGFKQVLERIAEVWRSERTAVLESSGDMLEQIRRHVQSAPPAVLDPAVLDSGFYAFRRIFDSRNGGFGSAPKFPRPAVLEFLLRYHARTGNLEALDMVFATLNCMARGGIYDHLGGGFHRYATDERWFVPHFEKMLYDQAQLAVSYIEGHQLSGDRFYATAARGTLDYVLRDMTAPEGGFYSAEDADSVIDPARPAVKGEGAYYVWTKTEIDAVLGRALADRFIRQYGIEEGGNVREDPQDEFAGKNILSLAGPDGAAALEEARKKLLEARSRRPRPHRDDKILTAWNGLMISAFAKGAQVLGEAQYLDAARRAAGFVLAHMYDPAAGTLLRRYRDGEAAIPGFLDDYAFLIQGLLDLYDAGFDFRLIGTAIRLAESMVARFEDAGTGGFFATAADEPSLVLRIKDDYDGAEPSGNSIAILDLLRLARITGGEAFHAVAEKALAAFAARMGAAPETMPQMLAALEYSRSKPVQIVLAGARPAVEPFLRELRSRFLPGRVVLLLDSEDARRALARHAPEIEAMQPLGSAAAYVCENFACRVPTADPSEFARSLDGARTASS